jgi:ribonuclease P protein component
MSLQAAERAAQPDGNAARFGITVTRKVGNAVVRNRVKRRLRAALRSLATPADAAGEARFDYVVVARREALAAPFDSLLDDLRHGIAAVHAPRSARPSGNRSGQPAAGRRPNDTARSPESH